MVHAVRYADLTKRGREVVYHLRAFDARPDRLPIGDTAVHDTGAHGAEFVRREARLLVEHCDGVTSLEQPPNECGTGEAGAARYTYVH
jgi:hypothetical protein